MFTLNGEETKMTIYKLKNRIWSPQAIPTDGDLVQLGMTSIFGKREVVIDSVFASKTNYLAVGDLICFLANSVYFEVIATSNPCLGRLRLLIRNKVQHEDFYYYPFYIQEDFVFDYLDIEEV